MLLAAESSQSCAIVQDENVTAVIPWCKCAGVQPGGGWQRRISATYSARAGRSGVLPLYRGFPGRWIMWYLCQMGKLFAANLRNCRYCHGLPDRVWGCAYDGNILLFHKGNISQAACRGGGPQAGVHWQILKRPPLPPAIMPCCNCVWQVYHFPCNGKLRMALGTVNWPRHDARGPLGWLPTRCVTLPGKLRLEHVCMARGYCRVPVTRR